MWKVKNIKGRWQLVYRTNNSLHRGWNIFPNINIGYLKTKKEQSNIYQFNIRFDWFSFLIAIHYQCYFFYE